GNDLNRKIENLPSGTRLRPRCTMGDGHRPLRVCGTDRASSAQGIPKMCNPLRWYAAVDAAEAGALFVEIEPTIIQRVVALSGGHPHILQLLGSHLVEHENDDPDGMIASKDLLNSLRRICYADRVSVYEATIHKLQLYDKMDAVRSLMGLSAESPVGIVSRGFPTRIDREKARHCVDDTSIQWLVEHHILSARSTDYYGLLDEFLRIRLLLDEADSPGQIEEIESSMISAAAGRDDDNDDDDSGWDPDGEALE